MNGSLLKVLFEAFLEAFNLDDLEELILFDQDQILGHFVDTSAPLRTVVLATLKKADREGWLGDLATAAADQRPRNAALRVAAQAVVRERARRHVEAPIPKTSGLERLIDITSLFVNPDLLLERLSHVCRQVCRIEIPSLNGFGTGFLVGRDRILTNYHVIEPIIKGHARPGEVSVRFDYRSRDGWDVASQSFGLAENWLLACSAYAEEEAHAKFAGVPRGDELDFAVVALRRSPDDFDERDFVSLPATRPHIESRMTLYILQHPEGRPMMLSAKLPAMVALNDNETRLRYNVNTLPGASGAPIFNHDWELIGIHHRAGPDTDPMGPCNQGIPIYAIVKFLEGRLS